MSREEVIRIVQAHQAEREALGVASLSVFGSVARGEAAAHSDVDMLVAFSRPVGLIEFVRVPHYLETLLGCAVDLATEDALRPEMREQVLEEAVHA